MDSVKILKVQKRDSSKHTMYRNSLAEEGEPSFTEPSFESVTIPRRDSLSRLHDAIKNAADDGRVSCPPSFVISSPIFFFRLFSVICILCCYVSGFYSAVHVYNFSYHSITVSIGLHTISEPSLSFLARYSLQSNCFII